jgi:hypothetical protein
MKVSITRTSPNGLQAQYNSTMSAAAQVCIRWRNQFSGVTCMSIDQAEELQALLNTLLSEVGKTRPMTLGDRVTLATVETVYGSELPTIDV